MFASCSSGPVASTGPAKSLSPVGHETSVCALICSGLWCPGQAARCLTDYRGESVEDDATCSATGGGQGSLVLVGSTSAHRCADDHENERLRHGQRHEGLRRVLSSRNQVDRPTDLRAI